MRMTPDQAISTEERDGDGKDHKRLRHSEVTVPSHLTE